MAEHEVQDSENMLPAYLPAAKYQSATLAEGSRGRENKRPTNKAELPVHVPSTSSSSSANGGVSKPPPRPEPPRTPFMCFTKYTEAEMGGRSVKMEASVRVRRIADEWRDLPADERAYWDEEARQDKIRYDTQKRNYTGWTMPKRRAKKHPLAPKRPMSAFLRYSQSRRKILKERNPDMNNTDISRLLGEMWNSASAVQKAPHVEKELEERGEYKVAIAKWRLEHETAEMERKKKASPDSVRNTDHIQMDSGTHSFEQERLGNEARPSSSKGQETDRDSEVIYYNRGGETIHGHRHPYHREVPHTGSTGIDMIHHAAAAYGDLYETPRIPSPYAQIDGDALRPLPSNVGNRQGGRYYSSPPTVPGVAVVDRSRYGYEPNDRDYRPSSAGPPTHPVRYGYMHAPPPPPPARHEYYSQAERARDTNRGRKRCAPDASRSSAV